MSQAHTPTVRNITRAFRAASDFERSSGMSWYDDQREFARSLTGDLTTGAGIVAALSPMTSWPENVKKSRLVVSTGTAYGLAANAAKAKRICDGEHPLSVLSGPKVTAFYLNLMGEHSIDTVTVDRHAADIAVGHVMTDDERSSVIGTKKKYASVAAMYIRAAAILSKEYNEPISPAQVQAVTWVYWRLHKAKAYHGD